MSVAVLCENNMLECAQMVEVVSPAVDELIEPLVAMVNIGLTYYRSAMIVTEIGVRAPLRQSPSI